jgi:hypothetical protein
VLPELGPISLPILISLKTCLLLWTLFLDFSNLEKVGATSLFIFLLLLGSDHSLYPQKDYSNDLTVTIDTGLPPPAVNSRTQCGFG